MCYERQLKLDRQSRREFKLILAAIVRHQESPDFDPTERFYRPERFKTSQDGQFSRIAAPYADDWTPEASQPIPEASDALKRLLGESLQTETLLEMVSRVSGR
jgi:hypothetical protein